MGRNEKRKAKRDFNVKRKLKTISTCYMFYNQGWVRRRKLSSSNLRNGRFF